VHCPRGDISLEARLHFIQDGAPVRVLAQAKNRQKDRLFEGAKSVSHRRMPTL
jgi:hypothetical protein